MKNRYFLSLTATLILGLGLMAVLPMTATFAQKKKGDDAARAEMKRQDIPMRPNPKIVSLKCEPASSDVSVQVRVTNTTGQTIPKGTQIIAKQAGGLSSTNTLSSALVANDYVKFTLGGHWTDAKPCTAYYVKQ